jgi:hypothetical protein
MSRVPAGPPASHHGDINLRVTAVSEGAAGNFTVSGITTSDTLVAVVGVKLVLSEGTPNTIAFSAVNITSEFTITAVDTINNDGGTSLADTIVFVFWLDADL